MVQKRWDVFSTNDESKVKELIQQDWEYVMTYKDWAFFRKEKGGTRT
jgi:hypothetical protein